MTPQAKLTKTVRNPARIDLSYMILIGSGQVKKLLIISRQVKKLLIISGQGNMLLKIK